MAIPNFSPRFAAALVALIALGACESPMHGETRTASLSAFATKTTDSDEDWPSQESEGAIQARGPLGPDLAFPIRFGLARIHEGQLSVIPRAEAAEWQALRQRLSQHWYQILPLSPLVTAAAGHPLGKRQSPRCQGQYMDCLSELVRQIRAGADRQQLNVVLLYEAKSWPEFPEDPQGAVDHAAIGLWMAPHEMVETGAAAEAVLLDVRSGRPFGLATTGVPKFESDRAASQPASEAAEAHRQSATTRAVAALVREVETMLYRLGLAAAETRRQRRAMRAPTDLLSQAAGS